MLWSKWEILEQCRLGQTRPSPLQSKGIAFIFVEPAASRSFTQEERRYLRYRRIQKLFWKSACTVCHQPAFMYLEKSSECTLAPRTQPRLPVRQGYMQPSLAILYMFERFLEESVKSWWIRWEAWWGYLNRFNINCNAEYTRHARRGFMMAKGSRFCQRKLTQNGPWLTTFRISGLELVLDLLESWIHPSGVGGDTLHCRSGELASGGVFVVHKEAGNAGQSVIRKVLPRSQECGNPNIWKPN